MRCYLMVGGHIAAVEFLTAGTDDGLIEQARTHFARRGEERFDGFEVWDAARRVYAWPEGPSAPAPAR
jgi:hypothetical protein